jgi:hypothetical protein
MGGVRFIQEQICHQIDQLQFLALQNSEVDTHHTGTQPFHRESGALCAEVGRGSLQGLEGRVVRKAERSAKSC